MRVLKRILNYFIWTLIAFISAFGYTRIILGPKPEEDTGFLTFIFSLIYKFGFVRIGLIIGSIIALLFILIDVFYLNKRLNNSARSTIIRFLIVIGITMMIAAIHYILEKVIDVI